MVDLDPEIWNNPTLGAQNLPFLDEVEAQDAENRRAAIENREPMIVRRKNRHPGAALEDRILEYVEAPKKKVRHAKVADSE